MHRQPARYSWKATDPEFRNRHRYVDLFINPESRETFKMRSKVVRVVCDFFEERDFAEVETPILQVILGGASARPFITHHNALDMELYLRIAPELNSSAWWSAGSSGSTRSTATSATKGSTKYNPEFTMLEFYWAYANWKT